MIVSALLQPWYNLLHATLLHSGWWALHKMCAQVNRPVKVCILILRILSSATTKKLACHHLRPPYIMGW